MFKKIANAKIADPVLKFSEWEKMYGSRTFGHKTASAEVRKMADNTRYLLSHCTIMASVMTEKDADWLIKPECSHLVNNNDDAWTNEVLKLSHKSFTGAFNFVEHYQNSSAAKGHILDAVLRRVQISPPDIWVYFCDILVATDMAHTKLVNDIRSGEVRYLSMGCVTDMVICSYCGAQVTDAGTYCTHLSFQKGMFLVDEDGISRRVAELCGHQSMKNGGVRFVEASWVGTPAFPGAAKRSIVAEGWLGPKSPYTNKAAVQGGLQKVASQNTDYEALSLNDSAPAEIRRKLR